MALAARDLRVPNRMSPVVVVPLTKVRRVDFICLALREVTMGFGSYRTVRDVARFSGDFDQSAAGHYDEVHHRRHESSREFLGIVVGP